MKSRKKTRLQPIAGILIIAALWLWAMPTPPLLAAAGNIDPSQKYAWSENAGWHDFRPAGGGVSVYPDHLEGFAWSENLGWIKLGSNTTGGTLTYANTSASDWGVNRDDAGNLSGFAWSEAAGWINFNPTDSQVTIDPATGDFNGYAWSENVGWIHFQNAAPAYKVSLNGVNLSVSANAGAEADATAITVTATASGGVSGTQTVDLTVSGTGIETGDYALSNATLAIPDGASSGSETFTVVDDNLYEGPETAIIAISNPSDGISLGAEITQNISISDNDPQPAVTLSLAGGPFAENSGAATVTATLSHPSVQDVTIDLLFSGSATGEVDYAASGTSILIAAGTASNAVTLTGVDDALDETDETVVIDINGVTNGTESGTQQATASIIDDDAPPTVQFASASQSGPEDAGPMTVGVVLSAPSGLDATIPFTVSGAATGGGTDYAVTGSPIVIPAGDTEGAITITPTAETLLEADETVILALGTPTNATASGTTTHTATIANDDAPPVIAQGDAVSATMDEDDAPTPWSPPAVSATDADDDPLTWSLKTSPANGVAVVGGTGPSPATFTYTPDAEYNGADSFEIQVSDGSSGVDAITVHVTVAPVNDPPTITGSPQTTVLQGQPYRFVPIASDVDGDPLTFSIVNKPAWADFDDASGALTGTPGPEHLGTTDSIGITVSDDKDAAASLPPFAITVSNVNDAPVLDNSGDLALAGIPEDAADTDNPGTLISEMLTGGSVPDPITDADPTAQEGIAVISAADANGQWQYDLGAGFTSFPPVSETAALLLSDAAKIRFVPDENFNGVIDPGITFRAWDRTAGAQGATADVTVNGGATAYSAGTETARILVEAVNDAPSFTAGDPPAVQEDAGFQTISGWATFSPGPPDEAAQTPVYTIETVSDPSFFAANPSVATDGSLAYTPAPGVNGSARFTVFVEDSGGTANGGVDRSDTQEFVITVNPVNDPPAAEPDAYVLAEETPFEAQAPGVLANDADPDGDALTAVKLTEPANGEISFKSDGSFVYTPDPGFNGGDGFTYKANDGQADSAAATVTLTVSAVADAPAAADDAYATQEDTALTVDAPGVLSNDFDAEGNTMTAVRVTGPTHGTLTLSETGGFEYMPAENFNGDDAFTYNASDGELESNTATAAIRVAAVNDAPTAAPDAYSMTGGDTLSIAAPGVLSNDSDLETDALSAVLASPPSNGEVTLNSDGSFTYRPSPGFSGGDAFSYKAEDGGLASSPVRVSISVEGRNHAPVLDNSGAPALDSIDEDMPPADNPGTTVARILASDPDVADTITDPDPGALEGIAIFDADTENGQWQYDIGAGWTTVPPVSETAALLLSDDAILRFVPDPDFNGPVDPGIGFRAWDRTAGVEGETADVTENGGGTAFSAATETAAIGVRPVDDPPLEPPFIVYPEDGAALPEETVAFQGSAFADPDGHAHAESLWRIREAGRGYGCPTYPDAFDGRKTAGDLATYEAAGFHSGRQYSARVGYVDETGQTAWSEEITFRAGVVPSDEIVALPPGDEAADFDMVSVSIRPRPKLAASLFSDMVGDYDPVYFLIGGYDPISGDYVQFGDGLKIEPGRAYWFFAREGAEILLNGDAMSRNHPIEIPLRYNGDPENGWNMVAPPNGVDYDWSAVEVVVYAGSGGETSCDVSFGPMPIAELGANDPLDPRLWRWEAGDYRSDTQIMRANRGYWVKARRPNVFLRFTPSGQMSGEGLEVRRLLQTGLALIMDKLPPRRAIADDGDSPPAPPSGFGEAARSAGVDSGGGGCFINGAASR